MLPNKIPKHKPIAIPVPTLPNKAFPNIIPKAKPKGKVNAKYLPSGLSELDAFCSLISFSSSLPIFIALLFYGSVIIFGIINSSTTSPFVLIALTNNCSGETPTRIK